jgi:lambda family phage portal protein
MSKELVVIQAERSGIEVKAFGGGLEGAERTQRETALWNSPILSPDQLINPRKVEADARGRDMGLNDGYVSGAVAIHKDSIVGSQYRLNARPNWRVLGASEGWADEFQQVVESRFNLIAESEACWLDAARMNTLTGMIRLAVGGFVYTGEVLATAEWLDRDFSRPLKTAIQMISPDRLRNPNDEADERQLRRGIEKGFYGEPVAYHIRRSHPTEWYDMRALDSRRVPAQTKWGRKQVIHIIEQQFPDQSRGLADMVSALKIMRMTKKFSEVTLQNAVVNASFAAAIESELPSTDIQAALGGTDNNPLAYVEAYLSALGAYVGAGRNVEIDGAKIPVFFPGTKLNLKPMGTPGGVGSDFHESLLRHCAAALGVDYESLSRDFSKSSYASNRASMSRTGQFMQARKKAVADRLANNIYALVLEEEISRDNLPLPPGKDRSHFYEPLMKEAYTVATWIGSGTGQIDELKETQAALMRIKGGLSTYEQEIAKLGGDWRENFAQRAREEGVIGKLNLAFSMDAQKEGAKDRQQTMEDNNDERPADKKKTTKAEVASEIEL